MLGERLNGGSDTGYEVSTAGPFPLPTSPQAQGNVCVPLTAFAHAEPLTGLSRPASRVAAPSYPSNLSLDDIISKIRSLHAQKSSNFSVLTP